MRPSTGGSGHWETRTRVSVDPKTGRKVSRQVKVWVADPKPKQTNKNAAAKRAAAKAAAKAAAEAKAKAKAKSAAAKQAAALAARQAEQAAIDHAKEVARKRALAYQTLSTKQREIMRTLKNNGQQVATSTPPPSPAREQQDRRIQQQANVAAVRAAEAQAQRAQAEAEQRQRIAAAQHQRRLKSLGGQATQGVGLDATGKKRIVMVSGEGIKDNKGAREAEKILKQEAKNGAAGNGSSPQDIQRLEETYYKYGQQVQKTYVGHVKHLNRLLDKAKDQKLDYKVRLAAYRKAQKYYYANFADKKGNPVGDGAEFRRMFGDGKKDKGSYGSFFEQADQIAKDQREWVKRQAKASLQSRANLLRRHGDTGSQDYQDIQTSLGIYNENPTALGTTIDHYKIEVDANGRKRAVPVYRNRTMEEALQAQQAQMIMRQQALWQEHQQQLRNQFTHDRMMYKQTGMVPGPDGQYYDPKKLEFQTGVIQQAQRLWGDKMPPISTAADLQHTADALVRDWETSHPAPEMYLRRGGDTYYGSYGYDYTKINPEYTKWKEARSQYEESTYRFLSHDESGTPGFLDRLMTVPGVSQALTAFGIGVGGVGVAVRLPLKIATGRSNAEVSIPLDLLPEGIRKEVQAVHDRPNIGSGTMAVNNYLPALTQNQNPAGGLIKGSVQDILNKWWETPEGSKWLTDHKAELAKLAHEQDQAFTDAWLSGDLGKMVGGLVDWGSQPFTSDAHNLAFQLLADPLNGIPLNFTKYFARAKYAAGLATSANKLNPATWARFARDFTKVDEGVLKMEAELAKYEKELAKVGYTPERAADELRAEIAGIAKKADREAAIEAWFRKVGLNPAKVDAEQIFNIAEWSATKAAHEGGDLFTQQDELLKKIDEAGREAKRAERRAAAEEKAAQKRVQQESEAMLERGRSAQERLAIQREGDEARLKANADAVAGQQSAAREAVGTSPAPTPKPAEAPKPPEPKIHEPGPTSSVAQEILTGRKPTRRAADYPTFQGHHEYYREDAMGNLIPRDVSFTHQYQHTAEYRDLVKRAKAGDTEAQDQLAYVASLMRNQFRTAMEDVYNVASVRYTPTRYDLLDRAGLLTDTERQAVFDANRNRLRRLKERTGARNADSWVMGHSQPVGDHLDNYAPGAITPGNEVGDVNLVTGELDIASRGNRLDIGADLIEMRDTSPFGIRNAYNTFTHSMLESMTGFLDAQLQKFFDNLRNGAPTSAKFNGDTFSWVLGQMSKGKLGDGLTGWRDGGIALFEIFHQIRIAGDLKKLDEFSTIVALRLKDDPTDIFLRMWKVMESRTGMPWADAEWDVVLKFREAASVWGIDADLALASIPNGYHARRPPMRFGFSPNLQHLESLDDWLPAPPSWNRRKALTTITEIFTRNVGEPMQVVHYLANTFGDLIYGTPLRNRLLDEMAFNSTRQIGVEQMARAIYDNLPGTPLYDKILDRGMNAQEIHDFLVRTLTRPQKKYPNGSFMRPEFPELREAIQKAYWAGDLPLSSTRAHDLMYLMHMQSTTTRDGMIAETRAYFRYLKDMGEEEHARAFLQRIHAREFNNLQARWRAEMRGRPINVKDPITGESLRLADSEEWQMWREMGFEPVANSETAKAIKAGRKEASDIEYSTKQHLDDLAHERDTPSDAYVGVASDETWDQLATNLDEALKRQPSARKPGEIAAIERELLAIIKQAADHGGALGSVEVARHLEHIASIVREHPSANRILRLMQEQLGDGLLLDRVLTAPEAFAYQEALLRLRLKATFDADGKVIPKYAAYNSRIQLQLEDLLSRVKASDLLETTDPTGKNATTVVKKGRSKRVNLDEMRAQYEAEGARAAEEAASPQEIRIDPPIPDPTNAGRRSHAEELFQRLTGMTEEEYYASVRRRANQILRRKSATSEQKAAARQRLADVDLAEYALKVDKGRNSHIPWQRRAQARAETIAKHGKEAEAYIAPKYVAPYARDLYGAGVEQVRTWRRQLRRAALENAPSRVRRLGTGKLALLDHFPIELFDKVEQEVAAAIREARGWQANNLTAKRGSREELKKILSEGEVGGAPRFADRDPKVLAAKAKVLQRYGISMEAYDEARKVLHTGYVQRRTNAWLIAHTDQVVEAAKKLGVQNPSWDKAYLKIRERLAREEAQRQLGNLAYGEMYGHTPSEVLAEFKRRWSFDGELRDFTPTYSSFQKRTLEEAINTRTGGAEINEFLQSANMPPFEKGREAVRDWLKHYGTWSPRKAEDFVLGKTSWDIVAEAEYWESAFGFVPDWTNPTLLGGSLNEIFHSAELYYEQMKAWGIFNRSNELRLRLDGVQAKAIEEARIHGDPILDIPARRELEAQRKYVVERYGDLVGHTVGDGVELTAMPWLMYPDELGKYMATRTAKNGLPEGMIQSQKQLDEVVALIQKHTQKYIDEALKQADGAPLTYEDIYRVASRVQAEMMADPVWAKRMRDVTHDSLSMWAKFNRWLIFSNPAFAVMNMIDVPIKMAWYRLSRRGLFNPGLHGVPAHIAEKARALTPAHLGLDAQTTIYYLRQRKALQYFTDPRKDIRIGRIHVTGPLARAIDSIEGVAHAVPEIAGRTELAGKMELARGMYPQVYEAALRRLKDPDLADAWTKKYLKREIERMWPTAGDHPIEKLFNSIVPFSSYMVRNRVLFISEALANPMIFNKIEFIGRYIESYNLKIWADEHPDGEPMPEYLRRRIELPWAPGYYLDLTQFTDATRGLKPLYSAGQEMPMIDRAAQWIRLINPSAQALGYMVTNALGITQRTMWKPILDANGYPTGQYEKVSMGWTEPWSKDQPGWDSVFWFADAMKSFLDFSGEGWNPGNASRFVGQVLMFNAIDTYDKGSSLMTAYKAMQATDPEAARRWLDTTPSGWYLKEWMAQRAGTPKAFPNTLIDWQRGTANPQWKEWFALSEADRNEITSARSKIKAIREVYAAKMAAFDPTSQEYKDAKAEMYYRINEVYLQHPALMKEEVWSKTTTEWATQMADWQTDKLVDEYMAMADNRPVRADFKSAKAFNAAMDKYNEAKRLFLATYPEVKKRLAGGILSLEKARESMQQEWDATLGRISKRNEAIENARAIIEEAGRDSKRGHRAQDRLDILYLQNELDYSTLNFDHVAAYFSRADFEQLPRGMQGPANLRSGISLTRWSVIPDFNQSRYNKAVREGRLDEFLADEKYGRDMHDAIMYAKKNDAFGEFSPARWFTYLRQHPDFGAKYYGSEKKLSDAIFYVDGMKAAARYAKANGSFDPARWVEYMKNHQKLLDAYFARHKGKREEWARNDAYIRHISVWGKLVGAGKWDQANKVWDALPQWVKDRYNAKHPERRRKAQQTAQYMGYMQKWISYFDKGDKVGAMKYFRSLPTWARERYYQKHPDKRAQYEMDTKMATLISGYFATDKANQQRLLEENPDLKRWLRDNASSAEQQKWAILAAYQSIPSSEAWLRKVFRDKYPEIFSVEAKGEAILKSVYGTLQKSPQMLPGFEKWLAILWDTYAEMLKKSTPRPLNTYFTVERETRRKALYVHNTGLSAEQASR